MPSSSILQRLKSLLMSSATLALFDQCIVSGTRFATTMAIGRICGAETLGHYVLATGLIVALSIFLESTITKPYTVFAFQFTRTRRRVFGGSSLIQLLVTMTFAALTCLIAASIFALPPFQVSQNSAIAAALAIALPGVLVWEFARRFAFAQMRMGIAIAVDASVSILQVGGIICVGWLELLDVPSALLIVGCGAGLIGTASLYISRSHFVILRSRLLPDARRNWEFGRWMFAGQLIGIAQAYVVPILLAYHFNAKATGIVMACQTVVFLSNPFLIGIANWLSPLLAKLNVSVGKRGVALMTYKAIATIGAIMVLYWLALATFGNEILVILFGSEFSEGGRVIAIIGLAAISFGVSVATVCGLAAIDRPKVVLWGNGLGAVVAFATFQPFCHLIGLEGAAWSIAIGSLAGAMVHLVGFVYSVEFEERI